MKQRDTSCLNQWYVSLLLLFTLSATAQESSMRVDYLTIDYGLRDHRIQDIITDQEGFIWIATSVAVHKYDGELIVPVLNNDNNFVIQVNEKRNLFITDYSHVLITHPERQDRPLRTNIPGTGGRSPFLVDDPGNIWLGNEQGRFFHFRYTNDTIILVSEFKSATETQSPGAIHNLLREDPGRIWVAGKNGLFFFDPGKDTVLTPCSLRGPESRQPQPAVYCMHFDKKRNLWMGTSEGLCLVSPAEMTHTRETFFLTDKMSRFFPAFKKLDKEVVYTICSDRDGRFFLRTGKGIYSTNRSKSKLDLLIKEDLQSYRSFYGFSEYALQYTQDGILLFGTDRGIGKINMNQKSFSILKHDPADPESLSTNKLCQVLKDRKGNLWVGTVGNGLNKGIPEGDGYRFEHFVHDPDNPFSLHSDEVTHLFMDHEGTVWVGAWSLQRIDESTGQVRFVYPDFIKNFPFDLSHVNVVYIEEDIRSNLFFCISDISLLYDRESRRLDWFYLDRNKSYSNYMKIFVTLDGRQFCSSYPLGIYEIKYPLVRIDSFSVCPEGSDLLYKDDKLFADYYFDMELFEEDGFKDIWTPTFLNFRLTYDEDNKASMVLHHAYTEADGIPYDYYDEMIEHNDQLWATTIKGLACIDRKKKSICNFYSEDGLPTNFFYYGRFKDESGKLYFCTTDGLLFFYPDSVTMPEPPEVRLRSVSIHRKIRLSRKEGISRDSVQTEVV
jgi:ligand-binding sensor domain-containing protein